MQVLLETGGPIDVPKPLNDEQIRQYVQDGYVAAEGLVNDEDVERLRADTVKLARGGYPSKTLKPLPADMSDAEVVANILCIHQPHFVSDVMLEYAKHPPIAGALSQIVGAHLLEWDGSVNCMQSMLFVKPPNFQGQAWHQDEIYIPTRDRSLCGAWIALDDATIENGCLWVLPGSHRNGMLFPQRDHEQPDEFDFAGMSYGFDDSGETPVEVKAGTVVFFNGYLLHRSRKNRSDRYRRVLVSHYCNAWTRLPWSVNDGEAPSRANRRCVIPVSGIDPYAWQGDEPPIDDVHLRTCQANEEGIDADAERTHG